MSNINFKSDFPVFQAHPNLVYLDNTATTQKPASVIDGVAEYLRTGYANIHRGSYELSEISERLYEDSKKIVAKHIGAENWREIIYTGNSTYALNFLAQSIWRTGLLKAGDTVLVSIVEHHANVVPWLILKEDYGINVEFMRVTENFDLDYNDFRDKLTDSVKIVSLAHVSNTTGQIFDIGKVNEILDERYGPHPNPLLKERERAASVEKTAASSLLTKEGFEGGQRPILIVDASQSVPHFQVDVKNLGCDALFFTGHKIFADSGIGVLWAREEILHTLKPIFSGGGAIGEVTEQHFTHTQKLPDKFEPGTPNLTGAVSILRAFEYIESIGGYEALQKHEHALVEYTLEKFRNFSPDTSIQLSPARGKSEPHDVTSPLLAGEDRERCLVEKNNLKLIGSTSIKNRVGVFTFVVSGIHSHDIAEYLAEQNICIRAGQHCAEPAMEYFGVKHTCRMSLHLYNTREDIDRFFEVLKQAIGELS